MFTPRHAVHAARLSFAAASVVLAALFLGPFQGLEQALGLDDKTAHVIAFYGLSVALFAVAPGRRRNDLALYLIAAALAVELLQGLTGRSVSILDFTAGAVGIGAAWLPGAIERLRYLYRARPDMTFAEIAARDKRRRRKAAAAPSAAARKKA